MNYDMRNFYLCYSTKLKLQPLVAEIGWTHNLIIMEKCKDDLQREFYMRMTGKYGWTKNVLIHQIENHTYEKTLVNQTNFEETLPLPVREAAKLAVKDEYTFDFLELNEEHTERQMEKALLLTEANIKKKLASYLDDELLSEPVVMEKISGGDLMITFGYEEPEFHPEDIAVILRNGPLPGKVSIVKCEEIHKGDK